MLRKATCRSALVNLPVGSPLMPGPRDPQLLMALAAAAVLLLLILSGPAERRVDAFSEASPGEGVEIECRLVSSKATAKGSLVELEDTTGGRMGGLCTSAPPPGSVVRVRGTVSSEGGFLFIDRIEVIGQSY